MGYLYLLQAGLMEVDLLHLFAGWPVMDMMAQLQWM